MRTRQQALNKVMIDWCLPISFLGEKQNDIGYASWLSDYCLAITRISLFQLADIDGMFGAMCPTQFNSFIASFKLCELSGFALFQTCFAIWLSEQQIELSILFRCSCPAARTSHSARKKPVVFHSLLLNQTSSVFLTVLPSSTWVIRRHLGGRG